MKKLFLFASIVCFCLLSNAQILKRADSFFGIHFDFHATENNKEIGKTFTAEMIDSFLTIVKPDFVQVDCKGHPGYTSYPTKVGNPPSGYTKDILKIWREVTARHNVALYVHYSGIMEKKRQLIILNGLACCPMEHMILKRFLTWANIQTSC